MGIDISVLMGANIANEVAAEKFCETTIGTVPSNKNVWNIFLSSQLYTKQLKILLFSALVGRYQKLLFPSYFNVEFPKMF